MHLSSWRQIMQARDGAGRSPNSPGEIHSSTSGWALVPVALTGGARRNPYGFTR